MDIEQSPSTKSTAYIMGGILVVVALIGFFGFYKTLGVSTSVDKVEQDFQLSLEMYNARVAFEEEIRGVEEFGNGFMTEAQFEEADEEAEQELQNALNKLKTIAAAAADQQLLNGISELREVVEKEDAVKGKVKTGVELQDPTRTRAALEEFDEVVEEADEKFNAIFSDISNEASKNIGALQNDLSLPKILSLIVAIGALIMGLFVIFRRL